MDWGKLLSLGLLLPAYPGEKDPCHSPPKHENRQKRQGARCIMKGNPSFFLRILTRAWFRYLMTNRDIPIPTRDYLVHPISPLGMFR